MDGETSTLQSQQHAIKHAPTKLRKHSLPACKHLPVDGLWHQGPPRDSESIASIK